MTQFLFLLGIFNTIFFKKNIKRLIYFFIILIPYLGFIQIKIRPFTNLSSLIQDIIFIIPIIIIFLSLNKIPKIPKSLKISLIFFIIILIIQFLNPWGPSILIKLVGLKVWLFYFLLIPVGMLFISEKKDLKNFCNIFAISSIIPFIIGIVQFSLCQVFGSLEVMTLFYGDYEAGKLATQNFTFFQFGDIKIYRVASTFSFIAQYNNYIIISLIPIITSVALSKTSKEKKFYKLIFMVAIFAAATSGTRGNFFYFGIFFITFISLYKNLNVASIFFIFLFLTIFFYFLYFISPLIKGLIDYAFINLNAYILIDIFSTFSENIFGNGLGSGTNAARYVGLFSERDNLVHEGYYIKTIYELGIIGLIVVLILFLNFIRLTSYSKYKSEHLDESIFCMLVHSFLVLVLVFNLKGSSLFDNYPSNLLFFLFLGMVIKIGSAEYLENNKI